ncbi:MAG: hypothetical protein KAV87_31410 [Desulfobacteraceae bacterium]|nr:hypothetical protein [Desulfobacteraceae bacterium]
MAKSSEIIEHVLKPMEAVGYKMPKGDGDKAAFTSMYCKILAPYPVAALKRAMITVIKTYSYTPKPAEIIKVLNFEPSDNSGLILLKDTDDGYWPWVEHKFPNISYKFRRGAQFHNQLYVPTPFPPGEV